MFYKVYKSSYALGVSPRMFIFPKEARSPQHRARSREGVRGRVKSNWRQIRHACAPGAI